MSSSWGDEPTNSFTEEELKDPKVVRKILLRAVRLWDARNGVFDPLGEGSLTPPPGRYVQKDGRRQRTIGVRARGAKPK
jgi:hypothetical protein